jgi:hypothetical protein
MLEKRISLFLFAVLAVLLLYRTPAYHKWVTGKFGGEYTGFKDDIQHLSVPERMDSRFGTTYEAQMAIVNMLHKVRAVDPVMLFPPKSYVNALKPSDGNFDVPEPAVFYYFTGIRSVDKTSQSVNAANWVLLVRDHKLMVFRIRSDRYRDSLLTVFKQYN